MKITDITLTALKTGKNLVRIQTDAGVEGWAELTGIAAAENRGIFAAYLEAAVKPALVVSEPRFAG